MFQPATNILQGNTALAHNFTSGDANYYIHYHRTKALDTLQVKFVFGKAIQLDDIPKQSGNTIQWYRYQELASNTTAVGAASEGSIGTGLSLTSNVITATLSQYKDFMTFSDRVVLTAIDEGGMLAGGIERMSYRAGLSVDTITRNEIDSISAADRTSSLAGTEFSAEDMRSARAVLQGANVQPMQSGDCAGYFLQIHHPYVTFDILNDPTANNVTDLVKYTETNPFEQMPDRDMVFKFHGIKAYESNNVKITAGSPTKYRTYIFGNGGIGGASINSRKPADIKDPKKQRFNLMIGDNLGHSVANPMETIKGYVSYNFMYVAKVLTDTLSSGTQNRFVFYDAPTGVV